MKYIFIFCQRCCQAKSRAWKISRSVTFLLITRRKRSLPASGTMVMPVLRNMARVESSSAVRVDGRSDGMEKDISGWIRAGIRCSNSCN